MLILSVHVTALLSNPVSPLTFSGQNLGLSGHITVDTGLFVAFRIGLQRFCPNYRYDELKSTINMGSQWSVSGSLELVNEVTGLSRAELTELYCIIFPTTRL